VVVSSRAIDSPVSSANSCKLIMKAIIALFWATQAANSGLPICTAASTPIGSQSIARAKRMTYSILTCPPPASKCW